MSAHPVVLYDTRERVIVAVLRRVMCERMDPHTLNFDADLKRADDLLDQAVREYARVRGFGEVTS